MKKQHIIQMGCLALALALASCGGRSGIKNPSARDGSGSKDSGTLDLAVKGDWKVQKDLGGKTDGSLDFCTGSVSVMEVNGNAGTLSSVKGEVGPAMSCCMAPTVRFAGQRGGGKKVEFTVQTKWQVGVAVSPPATIQLQKPPSGWAVQVSYFPCSPASGCKVMDIFTTSGTDLFNGWVKVDGKDFADRKITLCLTARRASPKPTDEVELVRLYARDIPIPLP